MDKEILTFIIQFMNRVQLTGQEVPAYNAAMAALNAEMKQEPEKEQIKNLEAVE